MQTPVRLLLAAAAVAAAPALASNDDACAHDPAAAGLQARVLNMDEKMDRIRRATDPAEQRRLMDLHGKLMREGIQQLRDRKPGIACRVELTDAMMDQMVQHQQFEREAGGR